MCNLSEGIMDKGIAKGLEKGRAEGHIEGLSEGLKQGLDKGRIEMASSIVVGLMKTTNKSMSEVLDMADIDKYIRPEVEKAIKAMIQSNR